VLARGQAAGGQGVMGRRGHLGIGGGRLHAWWNGHPLDRTRTSHLARLELALAA